MAVPDTALHENASHFVTDLNRSLTCAICVRPLYEPYTSSCGHTHCYSCLCLWFSNCSGQKSCADCRAPINSQPAPAYLIRELTHKITSKAEFLPEGETIAQHAEQRAEEAAKVEFDRANNDPQNGGLFRGMFRRRPRPEALRDTEDGVTRCPLCFWELEEGECLRCGYSSFMDEDSEMGHAIEMYDRISGMLDIDVFHHSADYSDSESSSVSTAMDALEQQAQLERSISSGDSEDGSSMESFIDDGTDQVGIDIDSEGIEDDDDEPDEPDEPDEEDDTMMQEIQDQWSDSASNSTGEVAVSARSAGINNARGRVANDSATRRNNTRVVEEEPDDSTDSETDAQGGEISQQSSVSSASRQRIKSRTARRRPVYISDDSDEEVDLDDMEAENEPAVSGNNDDDSDDNENDSDSSEIQMSYPTEEQNDHSDEHEQDSDEDEGPVLPPRRLRSGRRA